MNRNPAVVLVVLLLLITFGFFGKILVDPSAFLFAEIGDCLKSYFCTAFYVKYNSGLYFTGLNFPFGENLFFADAQPILAVVLRWLHVHLGMPAHYSIGIINSLIILSLPVAGLAVYKLLRMHGLPGFYSVAFALVITFMSPQIYRFNAHLALSQVYFVPVVWYLIIRIFNRTSWLWHFWFVAFSLLMGGFHAYLAVISAMFLLSYTLVYALQERKNFRTDLPFIAAAVFTAIAPAGLFNFLVKSTDTVSDRPENPFGFFDYYATPSSVFNPVEAWRQMNGISSPHWEGFAYVGLVALCVGLLTLLRFFTKGRRGFRHKRWNGLNAVFRLALPGQLRVAFWAAVLMLLFAFCLPFRISGFHYLPELIPPLKQFRSLGRFAWIFYYVFSVFVAVYLYRVYRFLRLKRLPQIGLAIVGAALLIWGFEAYATISFKAHTLRNAGSSAAFTGAQNNFNQRLHNAGVTAPDFQAILPLPFTHIGSEIFWIPGSETVMQQAMFASYQTGLPIASVMLSRTSKSQTIALMSLVSNPLLPRQILDELPSGLPLLLVVGNDTLDQYQTRLLSKAELISKGSKVSLYSLPITALQSEAEQALAHFQSEKDKMYSPAPGLFLSQNRPDVVIENFSGSGGEYFFHDQGSVYTRKGPLIAYQGVLPEASDTTVYEASVWVHLSGKKDPDLRAKVFGPDGELISENRAETKESVDVMGDWVFVKTHFQLKSARNRIEVSVHGRNLTIDNLLIRPKNSDVFYQSASTGVILKNNILLMPPSENEVF